MTRLWLFTLLLSAPALAAPKPIDRPQAKALYAKGVDAFQGERFTQALQYFEAARSLDPAPVLTYNIARVHEEMGQADLAIAAYQRYLTESPDAEDRVDVERRMRVMGAIARRAPETEPPLRRTTPPPRQTTPPPADADVTEVADAPMSLRPFAYGAGAAGIISLGAGMVFGLRMNQAVDDHADALDGSKRQRTADDADSAAASANVAFGVAAVLLLGAGALWYLEPDATQTALVPTTDGLLLRGTF